MYTIACNIIDTATVQSRVVPHICDLMSQEGQEQI